MGEHSYRVTDAASYNKHTTKHFRSRWRCSTKKGLNMWTRATADLPLLSFYQHHSYAPSPNISLLCESSSTIIISSPLASISMTCHVQTHLCQYNLSCADPSTNMTYVPCRPPFANMTCPVTSVLFRALYQYDLRPVQTPLYQCDLFRA